MIDRSVGGGWSETRRETSVPFSGLLENNAKDAYIINLRVLNDQQCDSLSDEYKIIPYQFNRNHGQNIRNYRRCNGRHSSDRHRQRPDGNARLLPIIVCPIINHRAFRNFI